MDVKKTLSKLLPFLIALIVIMSVPMLYFAPQYEGKQLRMHDVTQYQGMSKDINNHIAAHGEDPQWTGGMFGGMPAYQISMGHPSVWVGKVFRSLYFLGDPACFIFMAMLGFFIMLLLCGMNPWVGIIPSLAYGLSSYFLIIIGAGHINKMVALAYAPMMLGAVFHTYRGNMWLGAALAALFTSVELAANHPQITYYFGFIIVAFWINEGVQALKTKTLPRFAKATGLLFAAAVLAVGSNLSPLYYTFSHIDETIRGGTELTAETTEAGKKSGLDLQYITAWSYGKSESFNMFIPNLKGGTSEGGFATDGPVAETLAKFGAPRSFASQLPGYWGDQPITSGPTYIGAVVIFLAALALFLLPGRKKWWVVIVSLLAVLLAWGHNMMWFTELFYRYFPLYDKFRTVAMTLVIVQWSAPFLAAWLLHRLWKGEFTKGELFRAAKYALVITGGAALFFAMAGGMLFDFGREQAYGMMMQMTGDNAGVATELTNAMVAERASMLRGDALRSLLFVVLTGGVVMVFAAGGIKRGLMLAAAGVLVCADLIPVDLRYLPQSRFMEPKNTTIQPSGADREIMADSEPGFRVMNFTVSPFNDATTSYFHRSVGGYHGAKLQRYQDIIDRHLSQMNMAVYNMLNTKYFIRQDPQSGEAFARENPDTNGPAWFVDDVEWVASPDEEIAALSRIDTKKTAVADERFRHYTAEVKPGLESAETAAEITLADYRANRLAYHYRADEPKIAVFSEIYFKDGWTATIDGEPADYFRANYILRAMTVPAGEHTVVFSFRAPHFKTISMITAIFSALIFASILAVAAAAIIQNRKRRETHAGRQ